MLVGILIYFVSIPKSVRLLRRWLETSCVKHLLSTLSKCRNFSNLGMLFLLSSLPVWELLLYKPTLFHVTVIVSVFSLDFVFVFLFLSLSFIRRSMYHFRHDINFPHVLNMKLNFLGYNSASSESKNSGEMHKVYNESSKKRSKGKNSIR